MGCAGSFPSPESPASCYLVEADDARRAHLADAARPRQRRARAAPAARAARRSRRRPAQPPAPRPLPRRVRAVRRAALRARPALRRRRCPSTARAGRPRGSARPTAASPPASTPPSTSAPSPTANRAPRAVHRHPLPGRAPRGGVRAAGRGAGGPAPEVLAYTGDTDNCDALAAARQGRRPAARGGVVRGGPRRGARRAPDRPAGRRGRRATPAAGGCCSPTCPLDRPRRVLAEAARRPSPAAMSRWRARATSIDLTAAYRSGPP